MRFVVFETGTGKSVGVVEDGEIIDLGSCDERFKADLSVLFGLTARARIELVKRAGVAKRFKLSSVTTQLPITRPGKIMCLGLNYADHAAEGGHQRPEYPAIFMRTPESIVAGEENLVRPTASSTFDYEAELMVLIGKQGRHIPREKALEHVFGYTLFNDGSIREYQRKGAQWTPGKNFDKSGSVGVIVVTADELPAGARDLRILCRLNGNVMQDANTSDMLFPVDEAIAAISEFTTLMPGDMLAMGTPAGVGSARKPPVWMKHGDVVEVEIESIGVLRNTIVDEVD